MSYELTAAKPADDLQFVCNGEIATLRWPVRKVRRGGYNDVMVIAGFILGICAIIRIFAKPGSYFCTAKFRTMK